MEIYKSLSLIVSFTLKEVNWWVDHLTGIPDSADHDHVSYSVGGPVIFHD